MATKCKCGTTFDVLEVGGRFDGAEILRCRKCAAVMVNEYGNRWDKENALLFTRFFPTPETQRLRDEYKNRR